MPVEAAASNGSSVALGGKIDGQVQRYGAVAAHRIRQNVGVATACRQVLTVPVEAAASNGSSVALGGKIDGQVQRNGAVAARRIRQNIGVVTTCRQVLTVPVEAAASNGGSVAFGGCIHRQRQVHNAVASTRTLNGAGIFVNARSRCGYFETVFVIVISFTNRCRQIGDGLTPHCKMQDNGAVTTIYRLQIQLVVTRRADIEAVLVIGFPFANLRRNFRHSRRIQRQQQNRRVHAGINIGAIMVVITRMCDGCVRKFPVKFCATSVHRNFRVNPLVDGKVQSDHRITAIGIDKGLHIISRFYINRVVPDVVATDNFCKFCMIHRIDSQVQGNHGIAPVDISERLHVIARLFVNRIIPCVAFTRSFCKFNTIRGIDGQVQGNDAVTTFGVHQCVDKVAAFGQVLAVPIEAVANDGRSVTFGKVADGDVPLVHDGTAVGFRSGRDQEYLL